MVADFRFVVVGGGLASARAVKAYREAGGDRRLLLVSRDSDPPYHRPPLSKRYLRGEQERDAALVEPESFYADNDVEVMLETRVERVVPGDRAVELASGERVEYEKLLLATGAWPRRLHVVGGELEGIFTLRTLRDSTGIREAVRDGARAVVVGAGFIGMEVTASLSALGVAVTLVHDGPGLFDQFGCAELSAFLGDVYRERGVELVFEDEVAAFHGGGRVEAVETRRGRRLDADLVVEGIGVEPEVGFLADSGINVDDGVVVDERFRTSAPDVYAVGDVANFYDPLFQRRRRIEHWSNANYQGTQVGKMLAGEDAPYDTVSSFFAEVFGTTVKVFGDISRYDEVAVRGSFSDGDAVAFYSAGERLVGTLLTGQDEETEGRLKDAIRARGPVPGEAAAP